MPDGDGVFDRRDRCPNTPANSWVHSDGCPLRSYPASDVAATPAPVVADEVIVLSDLGNVLFAFDSAELTAPAETLLAEIGKRLVASSVAGHTDSVGADAYNQGLSERRAKSVADFLLRQGIAASKLSTEGVGESRPMVDNATDAGRAQNRRVELHVDR